jgi:BON domain
VKLRRWSVMALSASLGLSLAVHSQEAPTQKKLIAEAKSYPMPAQPSAPAPNPQLAQAIAKALFESGQLSRYQVNVIAYGGMVDLRGEVADESQRAIVVRIARSTPGVQVVRDWLQVRIDPALQQAQGPPIMQPIQLPSPQPADKDKGPRPGERIDGLPAPLPEPMPIFQAPPGPNPTMQPPPMPPYAWPTYAPYNNYSRVAYPLAYPYEQFPFIGPMYPFPRVPLGWRSVSLTWEDGSWWYHRNPTGHDWWRIRYH